jgi:predicted TPR repeat methyltransferase
MSPPGEPEDYRASHSGPGSFSDAYDETLFSPGTYDSRVWEEEKQLLDQLVDRWVVARDRYLDFACGTGRIIAHLESRFTASIGLDVSESMLAKARQKIEAATLVCGDGTRAPDLVPGDFDCITAWRFFLNAQPELRDEAMGYLAPKLRSPQSVLMFNVHGNRASTRWLMVTLDKLRGRHNNTMSVGEVRSLVARHGLEIVDWHGIMCLDKSFYNFMPARIWWFLERTLRSLGFPTRWKVYLVFVCRKAR